MLAEARDITAREIPIIERDDYEIDREDYIARRVLLLDVYKFD